MSWDKVQGALAGAKGIAFDGCHKIYVLMDDAQMEQMKDYGYNEGQSHLIEINSTTREGRAVALSTLRDWFENSCALRFVSAVATVDEGRDPNEGFTHLIKQYEYDYEEDDDAEG